MGQTGKIDSHFSPTATPKYYRGQKVRNLAIIFDHSLIWVAVVSKHNNVSEI